MIKPPYQQTLPLQSMHSAALDSLVGVVGPLAISAIYKQGLPVDEVGSNHRSRLVRVSFKSIQFIDDLFWLAG